jgi:hypothetical protein
MLGMFVLKTASPQLNQDSDWTHLVKVNLKKEEHFYLAATTRGNIQSLGCSYELHCVDKAESRKRLHSSSESYSEEGRALVP